ncbi:Probable glutathione S-transferase, partial [Linum perenne]
IRDLFSPWTSRPSWSKTTLNLVSRFHLLVIISWLTLPSLPFQRSHARFWADYIDNKVDKIYEIYRRMLWTSIVEVKEALIDCFRVLERELGDKPFLSGESFGFIDIVFISFCGFFYTFQELGNFKLEAECPKIVHWTQRCLQRESVSKSVADQHEVFKRVMEMKGKF